MTSNNYHQKGLCKWPQKFLIYCMISVPTPWLVAVPVLDSYPSPLWQFGTRPSPTHDHILVRYPSQNTLNYSYRMQEISVQYCEMKLFVLTIEYLSYIRIYLKKTMTNPSIADRPDDCYPLISL